jgi:hypothetical protein
MKGFFIFAILLGLPCLKDQDKNDLLFSPSYSHFQGPEKIGILHFVSDLHCNGSILNSYSLKYEGYLKSFLSLCF